MSKLRVSDYVTIPHQHMAGLLHPSSSMPSEFPRRTDGDRRGHQRFDIVGALWGVLELPEPARVRNVSTTGILIDASSPVAPDSVHPIRVLVDGELVLVDTRVRHVRASDEHGRFLIGLEFESAPTTVLASIEQLESPADTDLDTQKDS